MPADLEEIIDAGNNSVSYSKMIEHIRGEKNHKGDPDIKDIEENIEDVSIDMSYGSPSSTDRTISFPPRRSYGSLRSWHAPHIRLMGPC